MVAGDNELELGHELEVVLVHEVGPDFLTASHRFDPGLCPGPPALGLRNGHKPRRPQSCQLREVSVVWRSHERGLRGRRGIVAKDRGNGGQKDRLAVRAVAMEDVFPVSA